MAKVNLGRVVGRSAYEEAVRLGFMGTETDWLATLKGENAYQVAIDKGYEGTEEDWLASLRGNDGKTAYQAAQDGGFEGTEEEFNMYIASIGNINSVLDSINGEEEI